MPCRSAALLLTGLALAACSTGAPDAQPTTPTAVTTTAAPTATRSPSPAPSFSVQPSSSSRAVAAPSSPRATGTVVAAGRGYSVARVTAADLASSWRPGCPVAPARLRELTVPYVDFGGTARRGVLVVHESVADEIGRVFVRLRDARFPIRQIRTIDAYGGSDDRSMAGDNTSAFNCRAVTGGSGGWSEHAYGRAVDINPRENPYVYRDGTVAPPEGQAYVDRSRYRQGMVMSGGVVDRAFASIGWSWGGRFRTTKDYQHFSQSGG